MNVIGFIRDNASLVLAYTGNHIALVLVVLSLSLALWISTGLLISRHDRLAGAVIGLGNVIFCIPSISLFGLFMSVPGLGLGRRTATLVLVLYAMMPLVRSVHAGIRSVDGAVVDAGKGMGMTGLQLLLKIQVPMAWPAVFAGIRVTAVLITGIATMATFIGERNLGRLIHQGITRGDAEMIIAGALIVSVIALALDYVMGCMERIIISPGLQVQGGERPRVGA